MVVLLLPQKSFADITERKCKMNVTEIKPIEAVSAHRIRLAIYCRVSSDSEEQLHSFANQIRYYSTYTREHPEYELVDIYADEGITGTSMERRDEMNRMLADCKGGRIDRILTKSVSRFARNTEELLLSVRMLKEIGVSVYFEEQDIDTAKLSAEMLLTMPGVVAQQESISISENMRWSYRKRMERGEFNCCKAAYGFRMIDGLLEIFEPEAKVVRWMFRLALRGIGRQSIANLLTAKNISTPSGGRIWSYTSVDQILRNPRYMGDAILQERYTTQTLPFKRKKNNGEMPKYYVENANPAIVTREVFEAVQILLEKRRGSSYAQRNRYPFSGILYCPDCGKTFRRQTTNGKAYWLCAARAAGKTKCRSIRFPEERLEDTFTLLLHKLRDNRESLVESLIQRTEEFYHTRHANTEVVQRIDKEVADLTAKNHLLVKLYQQQTMGAEDYHRRVNEINRRILALRRKRSGLLYCAEESQHLGELRELSDILKGSDDNWAFNSEIFLELVDKMRVISKEKITFEILGEIPLTEHVAG